MFSGYPLVIVDFGYRNPPDFINLVRLAVLIAGENIRSVLVELLFTVDIRAVDNEDVLPLSGDVAVGAE